MFSLLRRRQVVSPIFGLSITLGIIVAITRPFHRHAPSPPKDLTLSLNVVDSKRDSLEVELTVANRSSNGRILKWDRLFAFGVHFFLETRPVYNPAAGAANKFPERLWEKRDSQISVIGWFQAKERFISLLPGEKTAKRISLTKGFREFQVSGGAHGMTVEEEIHHFEIPEGSERVAVSAYYGIHAIQRRRLMDFFWFDKDDPEVWQDSFGSNLVEVYLSK